MPVKIDSRDKRILILLSALSEPVSKLRLHRMVKELQDRGVRFGFRFLGEGKPYSSELQSRLERLVDRGYVFRLYLVGNRFYDLYEDYYTITDKGKKVAERMDVDKKDIRRILDYVKEIKSLSSSGEPTE